jgi:ABC-type multidrug transport system fused ATPase/permease subunit
VKYFTIPIKKEDLTFFGLLRIVLRSMWKEFRSLLLLLILLGALAALFQVAAPKVIQQIIDSFASSSYETAYLIKLSIFAGVFMLLAALFQFIADKLSFYIATQVEDGWKYAALYKYYRLPMTWHDQHDSGEIGAKLEQGASSIYSMIHEIFGQNFVIAVLTLLFVISYSFWLFPLFAIILLIPLPFYIIVTYFISRKIAKMQARVSELHHIAARTWYDGVGNLRYVKTFGKDYEETKYFAGKWGEFHRLEYETEKIWFTQSFLQKTIEASMRIVLLIVAAFGVKNGTLTIGQVVLLISFQQLTFTPLEHIHRLFTRLRRVAKRVSHLFDIVAEEDPLHDVSAAVEITKLKKGVTLQDVSFRYGRKMHALHGVTAKLQAGTTTAIVGRSGAGKSTLAMLLLRFYDPIDGSIQWDGVDLRNIKRESLRKKTTLILQDTTLFNRSIYDNVSYGNPSATKEQIEYAAKLAHAHEFIMELPEGYGSIVGERGVRLSGGQRQRIAIARALLVEPELLVMDEATSHLDSETELAIQEAIQYLHGKHTQVIIAHRLSTVRNADNILLMDKGRIIAQGKHAQLLRNPLYKRLCRLQLQK